MRVSMPFAEYLAHLAVAGLAGAALVGLVVLFLMHRRR